jgi:aspartate racemase
MKALPLVEIKYMHIGLIGGIGPAATDFYYRRLISTFAGANKPLELTIAHADTPTLLSNLAANNVAEQIAIYMKLTKRLQAAGAECVVVTSIAGHFCIKPFIALSPLPVVNMISEVDKAITQRGLKRIGILGTRTVMETKLYGSVTAAEILPPRDKDLDAVHEAYVAMAATSVVTPEQRSVFISAIERLMEDGAKAIMLGGTDLALAFNEQNTAVPLVDCASIHVDAIVKMAMW